LALKFNEISLDLDTPVYAIGEPCAAAAREFGFRGIYTARHGHGNEFAAEIAPLLQGRDALYLRARETVSKLEQILSSAGVRLHIGEFGAEEGFCAVAGQVFYYVGVFAATIIAAARGALGVFIGEHGALGLENAAGHEIFRGNHFQGGALAT